jgi:predicted ABC-class ATPase
VEVHLTGTGETITGLGIRRKEVFAITGANAEGKSSLLEAILSGMDDHADGDGREHLVSMDGMVKVDATNQDIRGGDVSRFFCSLPPGMGGYPGSATGRGSGSLSMAFRIQEAIRKERSLIVIDEDCAALNLLVPCYCGTEAVQPLSTLITGDREWLGRTGIVVAGSAMEMLIARCDRILKLSGHRAEAVSQERYRKELSEFYRLMSRELVQDTRIPHDQ